MLTLATEDRTNAILKSLSKQERIALLHYYRFPLAGFTDAHLSLLMNCSVMEAKALRRSLRKKGMVHEHGKMYDMAAYVISTPAQKVMHANDPNRKSKHPLSRNVHFPRSGA